MSESTLDQVSSGNYNDETWHVSTWIHRAFLATGCTTLLISLAKSLVITSSSGTWILTLSAAILGYILADLATGIYHWAIDNYGSEKTLVFGSQIESFQSHHQQPWSIAKRQLANNLHIPAAWVTAAVLPVNIMSHDPVLLGFVVVFAGGIMFSQLFHAWAHTLKGKLPPLVVALQDMGVIVGRAQHAAHHRPPYNGNYCILSGVWNRFLDKHKIFVGLEMVLHIVLGVKPRSWSGSNPDGTRF
ncbi:fatty acid desaturase 4, chloroplastic-like [Primulina tabacum]|uniref:fatty acid desaturase 4, chloroplastic-like n=1 Tax=Primulina tabacum TaxID=48773 RepID=UPI003F5A9C30